ncbi:hypothetical protein [Arenimonas metalli]|uniref:AsmA domain-containing protein n=1 Tax=Arenimonas metalli CF5-1 TaxID=1384056 RepID=A0A091BTX9_9GAMM|nr:hypothetical protein [Arenimonas metalli]KFN47790.1 hypothetical protein N787_07565 [Arenimonas metalli CF5-1]
MADAPRKRRWPWILAAFVVLAGLAATWVNRQLEPNRLTATVLARAGEALGLEFMIEGTPEYALRPEPRLVLPGLKVRQPGAAAPWILRAERAEVSLPWDTLTGGDALVITRVELQRPELDLAALASWQASRPPSNTPFELPTFTDGLLVRDGRLLGAEWAIESFALELPELVPDSPASAELSGRFVQASTEIVFAGRIAADPAGTATDLSLDANGRLRSGDTDAPWTLALAGKLDATGEPLSFAFDQLKWRSESPLPDLDGAGRVDFGDTLSLKLEGELPRWPEGWPALPEPLASSTAAFGFSLRYDGPPDASAPLALRLRRDETVLETTLVVPELLAWLDADAANPLPPLSGELQTPRLKVGGATLEGVRITLDAPPVGGTSVPMAEGIGTEVPPTNGDGDE